MSDFGGTLREFGRNLEETLDSKITETTSTSDSSIAVKMAEYIVYPGGTKNNSVFTK
jgi:hypothetical protein